MSSTCLDCGAALNPTAQSVWTCTNASCPGGTEKHLCGYCRESSFSPTTGVCANAACRTNKIVRSTCPTCQYQSVLTLGGLTFCLNRACQTHSGWVTTCPTCRNESLIQLDGTAVCVKSTCANLLFLVPWPATIGSRRGLGTPRPTLQRQNQSAPGTTALSRQAAPGTPRYVADPDASTVIPGGQPAASGQANNPAPRRYAVSGDASTIMPGAPDPSAKPMSVADSSAPTVLNNPRPRNLPPGFDEDAETVLQTPPAPKPKYLPPGFDENAETVMAPPDA
jgi:hypothetical protein